MSKSKIMLSAILCFAAFSLSGCGEQGNKVIQPTETYQPTEIERANAEKDAKEREELEQSER